LSLEHYERISSSLINPLETVLITGGEPFLRSDLPGICKIFMARAKRKKIVIPTNGLFTERILSHIADLVSNDRIELEIQVSLDGFKETHDAIRQVPGIFDQAITTAREIAKAYPGIGLYFMTTLWERNFKEALPLKRWVEEETGVAHKFQLVRVSGKGVYGVPEPWMAELSSKEEALGMPPLEEIKKFLDHLKTPGQYQDLYDHLQQLKNEYALNILTEAKPQLKCHAGLLDAVIYPEGRVAICEMTRTFAHLSDFDYNFNKLWNAPAAMEARRLPDRCFCIHSCNLLRSIPFDLHSLKVLAGV
jgi:MoaA/NifB/PqqE/SkfB family radical SAM enzyme